MQRPTLHARNAMQVFLPVDGRLHGPFFLAGRIMSLPDVPRLFRGQAGASPMISRMRSRPSRQDQSALLRSFLS
ncbi:hypothetical protein NXV90_07340 [Bacteroides ovatus]|nr:hypothetical protein [Bacteroides ovatus]MCS3252014.1 hypothetical protein [Bacteroides ovatus]